jgi:hypothetical protein
MEHISTEVDENNQVIYGNSTLFADGQVMSAKTENTL